MQMIVKDNPLIPGAEDVKPSIVPSLNILVPTADIKPNPSRINLLIPAEDPKLVDEYLLTESRRLIDSFVPAPDLLLERLRAAYEDSPKSFF